MKAIILAAGIGKRLGGKQAKCLLKLGEHRLIDYQLNSLSALGIKDIVIVLGYQKEIVEEYISKYSNLEFTIIHNPDYADTNTAYSLYLARGEMTDTFIYLNGDVLFDFEVLRQLVDSPALNALAIEKKVCAKEEVKVISENNRIIHIGKDIDPQKAQGEFIGLGKFSENICQVFRQALEEVAGRDSFKEDYFESALQIMAPTISLIAVDITEFPCVEIDFPEDLDKAQQILQALRKSY